MSSLVSPRVDLVVATYGQPGLLANCLQSVRNMHFRDYRLIVVDDASPELALPIVRATHPGCIVLRTNANGGLVRAMNAGIRHGTADLVALLNDDTEVSPEWLGALVDAADRYPNAASFASKLLLFEDPPRFHSAGDGFGTWGMPYNRGVWLDDLGQYDVEEAVFGACAGAALYRRAALRDVRLENGAVFDPSFFMYLEDVDLAWRLQRAGYSTMYVPSASVRHHLSASGGGTLASYYVARNIWSVLLRSMPRPILRRHWKRILAFHFGRNARHLRDAKQPASRAALRGTAAGLLRSMSMLRLSDSSAAEAGNFPLTN